MLIVLTVDPKERVVDNVEPTEGDQKDQCLPHPWASLDVASEEQPEFFDGWLAVPVGNDLRLLPCNNICSYRRLVWWFEHKAPS